MKTSPQQQLPAVIYGIGLILSAIVFAATVLPPTMRCAPDETTALCARNWVNASGSVFTGLIAAAAAFYAFRQWQETRKQALLSRLPHINDRIIKTDEVIKKMGDVFHFYGRLFDRIRTFHKIVTHYPYNSYWLSRANEISVLVNDLDHAVNGLRKFENDLLLDQVVISSCIVLRLKAGIGYGTAWDLVTGIKDFVDNRDVDDLKEIVSTAPEILTLASEDFNAMIAAEAVAQKLASTLRLERASILADSN